jgi:hypothetical protein
MISIILQNQIQAFATSWPSHSSIVLQISFDNKRWRREKRRDGEAKNITDRLKQRTEEIELFSKEKKRWRRRLSQAVGNVGCTICK